MICPNQPKSAKSQRLYILSDDDIDALYARPNFTDTERRHFFSLPKRFLGTLNIKESNSKRTASIVYHILQYGYFRAKHQFFPLTFSDVSNDVTFIMNNYLPNDKPPKQLPTRKVQRKIKDNILACQNYIDDSDNVREMVGFKLAELVKRTNKPAEIFDEIIKYLTDNSCVVLGYKVLQDLIGSALKNEEKRLISETLSRLTGNAKQALETLLTKDYHSYLITTLQCDAKNFQYEAMQKELEKLELCESIYQFGQSFLIDVELSQGMITYYSDLIHLYQSNHLKKINRALAYLYMTCYVQGRYEKIMNNVVQAFLYHIDKEHNQAKKHAAKNLPEDPGPLEPYETQLGKLIQLFTNSKVMKKDGRSIQEHAFSILPEEKIKSLSYSLLKNKSKKSEIECKLIWQYHKDNYHSSALNLRPLFSAIAFEDNGVLKELFKAYRFWLKLKRENKKLSDYMPSRIPMSHIRPKSLQENFKQTIMTKKGKRCIINSHQYEFYLYRALRENIKQRKVVVNTSNDYKSLTM